MKIEFTDNIDRDELSFKAGDIVALKADIKSNKTKKAHYYLIGINKGCLFDNFYLTNIKTGERFEIFDYSSYVDREELIILIKHYQGKVYRGDKAKLLLEGNN